MRRVPARPLAALVSTVLAAALVAGCGGGDEPETPPPTIGGSSSSAAETPTSASPTALPTATPAAAKLHLTVLGRNAARGPQQKAVVETWMAYWAAVTDTYYDREASPGLDSTARGSALEGVLDYLARLRVKKQKVVGWAKDNVLEVKVNGSTAVVRDCTRNMTFTVDASGKPTETPAPWLAVTGVVSRQGGGWRVVSVQSTDRTASCLGGF